MRMAAKAITERTVAEGNRSPAQSTTRRAPQEGAKECLLIQVAHGGYLETRYSQARCQALVNLLLLSSNHYDGIR